MTDHNPAAMEYNEGSVGRISNLMLDVQELQEPLLYASALRPMPIEWARQLMYAGKHRFSKKCEKFEELCGGKRAMTTNRVIVFVCKAGKSLQEWVNSRSRKLYTKKKRKRIEKGQTMSAGNGPEVLEVVGQRREEHEAVGQATSKAAGKGRSEVEEVAKAEVPLFPKKRRLMRAGEIVSAGEGASAGEVVPTGDGAH